MKYILLLPFIFNAPALRCQNASFATFCDTIISWGLKEKLIPGIAVAIISSDSTIIRVGGLSDIQTQKAANRQTLFQIGSVGKVFTALAALQLVEQGKLDLHTDIQSYLGNVKIENRYAKAVTLYHLLTHTAGFNDQIIGYGARTVKELEPLEVHLKKRTPTLMQEPGYEINYSNYSYALAGLIIEKVSGLPFEQYVRKHIIEPLSMVNTHYILPDDYEEMPVYARGYDRSDTGFVYVRSYPRHPLPAGSIISTVDDMTLLVKEFLSQDGKILQQSTLQKLLTLQFTQHPMLMGYSLGLEEQRINGLHGWAKGGAVPGFLSSFVIFPDQKLGMFITTNTGYDEFFEQFVDRFFNTFYPGHDTVAISDPQLMDTPAGTYSDRRTNKNSIEEMLYLFKGRFDLWKSKEGYLSAYHNGEYQTYQPVSPNIFQNQERAHEYLVFQRDAGGKQRLYRNANIGGFYIPVSLEKLSWFDDPTFINEYYFLVLVVIWLFIFILPFRLWVYIRRKRNPLYAQGRLINTRIVLLVFAILVLYTFHFIFGFLYFFRHLNDEFFFGVPEQFRLVQYTTYTFPLLVASLAWICYRQWKLGKTYLFARIYLTLILFASAIHLLFIYRWHFLGQV